MKSNKTYLAGMVSGVVICLTLIVFGCVNLNKPTNLPDPKPQIENIQNDIEANSKALEGTTKEIKDSATEGQKVTPRDAKPILDPFWIRILTSAGKQDTIVEELKAKNIEFEQIKSDLDTLQKFTAKETARADKAEQQRDSAIHKNAQYLIFFGGIGVAAAIAIVIAGSMYGFGPIAGKIGIFAGIFSGGCVVVGIFILQIQPFIPWIVLGTIGTGIGLAIWYIRKGNKVVKVKDQTIENTVKSLSISEKANKQLVKLNEGNKQLMTESGRKKVYGDGALVGLANVVLDADTQKIVEDIRKKITKAPSLPVKPVIDIDPWVVRGNFEN